MCKCCAVGHPAHLLVRWSYHVYLTVCTRTCEVARHSMSADLCFTTDSFFLFFRCLISEVAERNSTKIGHMLGSNCNVKTHVQNLGYPLPYKSGGQNPLFGRLRNLTATLTAYVFGTKHDIDNRSSALTTTRGLLHRPKCHELWFTNGLKLDLHFIHPP